MTIATRTFNASADFGNTGQYVARLIGRDSKLTFQREFIGTRHGKRNDSTEAIVDDPCLIERCNVTRKGKDQDYWIVVFDADGNLRSFSTDKADAMAIAKRIGAGDTLDQIIALEPHAEGGQTKDGLPRLQWSLRTAAEAKRAVAAVNVDAAVTAIVTALAALPANLQKKAIANAKERLLPKTTETQDGGNES